MTTPDYDQQHTDLVTDLHRTLNLPAGLAAILPGTTGYSSNPLPHTDAHEHLVAGITGTLRLNDGLGEILGGEAGHHRLLTDLTSGLDTGYGLIAIVDPSAIRGTRSTDGTPPPLEDSLTAINAVSPAQRLLLRAGALHQPLDAALRAVHHIESLLHTSTTRASTTPDTSVIETLLSQQTLLDHIADTFARALPSSGKLLLKVTGEAVAQEVLVGDWRSRWSDFQPNEMSTDEETEPGPDLLSARGEGIPVVLWERAGHRPDQPPEGTGPETPAEENSQGSEEVATSVETLNDGTGIVIYSRVSAVQDEIVPSDRKLYEELLATYDEGVVGSAAYNHAIALYERAVAAATGLSSAQQVDRAMLADAAGSLAQVTDELSQLRFGLEAGAISPVGQGERDQSLQLTGSLIEVLTQLWDVISDLRGADLHDADPTISLEHLDGVRWTTADAEEGATRWPDELHHVVADHSLREENAIGVFVVRFGAAVGTGGRGDRSGS